VGGAIGAVVCSPPYAIGRIGILMLARTSSSSLRHPPHFASRSKRGDKRSEGHQDERQTGRRPEARHPEPQPPARLAGRVGSVGTGPVTDAPVAGHRAGGSPGPRPPAIIAEESRNCYVAGRSSATAGGARRKDTDDRATSPRSRRCLVSGPSCCGHRARLVLVELLAHHDDDHGPHEPPPRPPRHHDHHHHDGAGAGGGHVAAGTRRTCGHRGVRGRDVHRSDAHHAAHHAGNVSSPPDEAECGPLHDDLHMASERCLRSWTSFPLPDITTTGSLPWPSRAAARPWLLGQRQQRQQVVVGPTGVNISVN